MWRGGSSLPARQRGQALIFIGITTVIVLLGVILLYNVAQLTTQKMKLQNTADAAAYSGVLLEARDYNFSAYANRAMIANQVTVAQLIGTISWLRNLDNVYRSGTFTAVPQSFASLSALGAMWTTVWNAIRVVVGGANAVASSAGHPREEPQEVWPPGLGRFGWAAPCSRAGGGSCGRNASCASNQPSHLQTSARASTSMSWLLRGGWPTRSAEEDPRSY